MSHILHRYGCDDAVVVAVVEEIWFQDGRDAAVVVVATEMPLRFPTGDEPRCTMIMMRMIFAASMTSSIRNINRIIILIIIHYLLLCV